MDTSTLKIIFGPACAPSLQRSLITTINALANRQQIRPVACNFITFKDGESLVQIKENVRNADVFVIQPTPMPDRNFTVLKMLLQAASLASAGSVTAVVPNMGYLRQDRKDRPRVPVTAKMIIEEIEHAMVAASRKHIMFVHPHSSIVPGFADIPTDVLYPTVTLARRIEAHHMHLHVAMKLAEGVAGCPDAGAAKLAQVYMRILHMVRIAFGFKTRNGDDQPEILDIAGDVKDRPVVVGDDMVDTGGTTCGFNSKLSERGALCIYDVATHPVFADGCIDRLVDSYEHSKLERVFVTNSINHEQKELPDFIEVVDIGPLIAEAIWRNFTGGSISEIDGMFAS